MWIIITLIAITLQTLKNIFSKNLTSGVGIRVTALCNFLFGFPFILLTYYICQRMYGGVTIVSSTFYLWILLFAVGQLTAFIGILALFKLKNFAVSVSFVKVETIFTAILAFLLIGEKLSLIATFGIIIVLVGLGLCTFSKELGSNESIFRVFLNTLNQKSTYLGLFAGLSFSCSSIGVKRSLDYIETASANPPMFLEPLFSLLIGISFQFLILFPYVFWKKRKDLRTIFRKPLIPISIGLFSCCSSLFWFIAFSIAYVAYVTTLGQVEFIIGIFVSAIYYKEKIKKNEYIGMVFMTIGILILAFN